MTTGPMKTEPRTAYSKWMLLFILQWISMSTCCFAKEDHSPDLPLFYWKEGPFVNFGDYISLKIVERITGEPVRAYNKMGAKEKKLLAVGSIFYFASDNDVIWGSGINGKTLHKKDYRFDKLDVRAVRGPLTRKFLIENFNIDCPDVYGDPGLLFPYLFPEFTRKENPTRDFIIIPHYSENNLFPKTKFSNVVYPTEPWDQVIEAILDSKFVISSSLHGIVIAEAYGIPARLLRITENESIFKYIDYYFGTNRPHFQFASSLEEALILGGEKPFECDLKKLYEAFPFEFWPKAIPNVIQKSVLGNAGAIDLQQAMPAPKQGMCKHMSDAGGCKDEDAGAAQSQFLNHVRYNFKNLNFFMNGSL
ncbi:MAG TPA: polysaccharide pyruvyl transferase family protein [Rhabdochlamydiaceae bacterium]|nr:polysaccharide pyruvyl transferase family protein [Rhabdochlamydiaceae bacterium]